MSTGPLEGGRQAPNITLAAEIKPGHRYLLSTDRHITAQEAQNINAKLADLFPGTTFGIMSNGLQLVTDTLGDLRDAVQQAGDALQAQYTKARTQDCRTAYSGGMFALRELRKALAHPERDRAGTPPAQHPTLLVAATSTPAPSRPAYDELGQVPPPAYVQPCGRPHPWMDNAWCTLNPHPDKRHEAGSVDAARTVVAWSEQ